MIDLKSLLLDLKVDEGFEPRVYMCSADHQTVGYGWNLEDNDMPEHIATQLLEHAAMQKIAQLSHHDWFCQLDDVRKQVIANMAFNIGTNGVLNFKRMIAAIKDKDYALAAIEMKDSKWHRQVGNRARRLASTMHTG